MVIGISGDRAWAQAQKDVRQIGEGSERLGRLGRPGGPEPDW